MCEQSQIKPDFEHAGRHIDPRLYSRAIGLGWQALSPAGCLLCQLLTCCCCSLSMAGCGLQPRLLLLRSLLRHIGWRWEGRPLLSLTGPADTCTAE